LLVILVTAPDDNFLIQDYQSGAGSVVWQFVESVWSRVLSKWFPGKCPFVLGTFII